MKLVVLLSVFVAMVAAIPPHTDRPREAKTPEEQTGDFMAGPGSKIGCCNIEVVIGTGSNDVFLRRPPRRINLSSKS
ncbi:hypothetical protein CCHR01_19706 [Colletotrichum chrysophilum]|uniref:Uncharacterized protein n=1 Tax=Colletotrichum chrysophilum TaxID=1836956 RepID=A0AAD8ZXU1_9PEZI|nr:hypothetical protein CCHR01_19706 [Colletotrichum chrysophilum]